VSVRPSLFATDRRRFADGATFGLAVEVFAPLTCASISLQKLLQIFNRHESTEEHRGKIYTTVRLCLCLKLVLIFPDDFHAASKVAADLNPQPPSAPGFCANENAPPAPYFFLISPMTHFANQHVSGVALSDARRVLFQIHSSPNGAVATKNFDVPRVLLRGQHVNVCRTRFSSRKTPLTGKLEQLQGVAASACWKF